MEKALRRGDENRPPTPDFRKYPVEWYRSSPAPSLRELARPQGVTEGVSSDGCSMPTIYTPAHIGSETFDRLRSSKYTPSVSHSLDSSLREGAGNGLCHSSYRPETGTFTGDFHRPYENSEMGTLYHSSRCLPIRSFAFIVFNQRNGRGDGRRPLGGYCSTSNLYPTPQTVFRFHLGLTPSSFSRRRFTWTSTVRESPK